MAERLERSGHLYAGGSTVREIAKVLGVSIATISRDRARIETIWRERAADSIAAHKARILAQLEEVYRQAMEKGNLMAAITSLGKQAELLGVNSEVKLDMRFLERRAAWLAEEYGLDAQELLREAIAIEAKASVVG